MKNFLKSLFGLNEPETDTDHISSFDEQHAEEETIEFIDHGEQIIPLENIIGSVGKYNDFDSRFRPKKHASGKRYQDIRKNMREGKTLPPVNLYQIRDSYYVLDGNHRVSAAKELGWTEIRGKVVELLSGRNTIDNLLYIEKKRFYEKTGLREKIYLTEVGKYNFLEKQIKKHQVYLASQSGRDCDFIKAAKDWYTTIYSPMETILGNSNLVRHFPERTLADLYTYISFHHWDRSSNRRYGIGIDRLIPKSMEGFRKNMLEKRTPDYPEMKRTITAFVLANVETSTEQAVIDALFALDGVQEVHSVHGSIDILVKIVLERDFLASDAEIIGEFVDTGIRRIDGINRTQTLIPGQSRVKDDFS